MCIRDSYSTSTAWRRQASLGWNAAVAAALRSNPLLRMELHPRDVEHAAIRRSWQRLLEKHLVDREAVTLARVAEEFRVETDWDSLGNGPELAHGPDTVPRSEDHEEELRGDDGDHGTDRDVARVVKPEHHA